MGLRDEIDPTGMAGWCGISPSHVLALKHLVHGGLQRDDVGLVQDALQGLICHVNVCVLGMEPSALPLSLCELFEAPLRPQFSFSTGDPDMPAHIARALDAAEKSKTEKVSNILAAISGRAFSPGKALVVGQGSGELGAQLVGAYQQYFQHSTEVWDELVCTLGGASVLTASATSHKVFDALEDHLREARGPSSELAFPDALAVVLERASGVRAQIPRVLGDLRAELRPSVTAIHERLTALSQGDLFSKEANDAAKYVRDQALQMLPGANAQPTLIRGLSAAVGAAAGGGTSALLTAKAPGMPGAAETGQLAQRGAEAAVGGVANAWTWIQRKFRPSLAYDLRTKMARATSHPSQKLLRGLLTDEEQRALRAESWVR